LERFLKVSLVIPIYNEAPHLKTFLEKIDVLSLPCEKELVFVNDHSTDGSEKILSEFEFQSTVKIIHLPKNGGKGNALHTGISSASGDVIGIQDADFEYDMIDLPGIIQPFIDNKADVVYGSRFKKSGEQVHRTFHYLINRILTMLSNLCCGLYLTDMETCYKFFRRDIITNINLESKRFGFEPEVTAKIARLKFRMIEIPISYYPRNYLQGKKISWKDGVAAIRHIFYFNFSAKPSQYLKPTLPKEYIPTGGNWL